MKQLLKELKFIINKELYQNEVISFEEFKLMNDLLMREKIK